ncbi:MAG: orotidine-5'-phosphate decarboxylase [Candidatus Dasytiphilus stammeri]
MKLDSPLIVALDYSDRHRAMGFVESIDPSLCRVKVGQQLFMLLGPQIVRDLKNLGFDVFLDLKVHDIPHTAAHAVALAAELGVWMITVHASGGANMMNAAYNALLPFGKKAPLLMGVTMLTSIKDRDLVDFGLTCSISEQTERLARLTYNSGLTGIISSANDAAKIKQNIGKNFIVVTPGIRLDKNESCCDDHNMSRIMTPCQALSAGVDYLVIGRSITQSPHPAKTITTIYNQIISHKQKMKDSEKH